MVIAAGALFQCPNGITTDDQDNIYVANFNNGNVIKITAAGAASVFATLPGNNNGHITFANDTLYVAALAAHQVWQLDLDGNASLVSGTGTGGNQDGPGSTATHFRPNGIDHSPDGSMLYINDVAFPDPDNSSTPNIVRRIVLTEDAVFSINPGLSGAWFNPQTPGQGFFLEVFPAINLVFLAWFTYEVAPAGGNSTAQVGHPGHRWLTAQGGFDGDTASLTVTLTTGGVFDDAAAVTNTTDGTIQLQFSDCSSGELRYVLTTAGLNGTIPLARLANDNVPLCESLDGTD